METSEIYAKREAVIKAQKEAKEAEEKAEKLLEDLQSKCTHITTIGLTDDSRKMCIFCGLEDTPTPGYSTFSILKNKPIQKLSSDAFYEYREELKPLKKIPVPVGLLDS